MERVRRWYQEWFGDSGSPDDELPDPDLAAFDHGLGSLQADGVLKGYLASVRTKLSFPPGQWQLWFVIVWADGSKELPFEDYGPGWYAVRELNAGYLDHFGPSTRWTKSILGYPMHIVDGGEPQKYEFAWLPPDEAAAKWHELGLTDRDF